eukprot:g8139.t1
MRMSSTARGRPLQTKHGVAGDIGHWALCRAHPDRLQLEDLPRAENTRADRSKGRSMRSSLRASSVRAEVALQSNGGSWANTAAWVLGLGEEAIFRAIVGYL